MTTIVGQSFGVSINNVLTSTTSTTCVGLSVFVQGQTLKSAGIILSAHMVTDVLVGLQKVSESEIERQEIDGWMEVACMRVGK